MKKTRKISRKLSSSFLLGMFLVAVGAGISSKLSEKLTVEAATDISDSYSWKVLATGAGGWITGIDINPDGNTRFARTDTYGAYRWTGTKWKQIVTAQTMPVEDVDTTKSGGVLDITSAPSDENRAYMAFRNYIYRSDNKGDNWTKTSGPNVAMEANDNGVECRMCNDRLVVDSANRDVVYFGSQNNGLYRSDNGGTNWTRVASVPNGQFDDASKETAKGRGIFIAIDKNSVQNGRAKKIYAASHKNGVYVSSDGGYNFSRIGSSPSVSFTSLIVTSDGTVFAGAEYQGIYRYKNGAWTSKAIGYVRTVASDPNNPNRLYALADGGAISRSVDGGDSWQSGITFSRTSSGDIPWLSYTDESYMSAGEILFDPLQPGRLWFTEGIGVWYADVSDVDNSVVWKSQSRGIEQLVGNDVIIAPGGKPVTASWDRAIFYHQNLDQYPTTHAPTSRFNSAWDIDYSAGNPNFMVANTTDHRGPYCPYWCQLDGDSLQAGYSTNGGKTWTKFANFPAPAYTHVDDLPDSMPKASGFGFGSMAVSSSDTNNIIWVGSNGKPIYYTKNRGQSWAQISLPGVNQAAETTHFAYYLHRNIITADKQNADTFYLYFSGRGTYRTTNKGDSWQLMSGPLPVDPYNATLKAVDGKAGHLFWTPGRLDGTEENFKHSVNGGASWSDVPNVKAVSAFGFGKAANGSSYPAIFITGKVNGDYGIWRSTDEGANWSKIGTYPLGIYDGITAIDGDKDLFGRVYLAASGSGFYYGEPKVVVTPTPTPTPTPSVGRAINGGGAASGNFAADSSFSGGSTYISSNSINVSGAANPAPAAVYQSERYGNFTYNVNSLTANATYLVRLHFAEIYWNATGQRVFNVKINGNQVLSNFDILAQAGGKDKAVVREFTATADASGQISIQFQTIVDNAKISGIEIKPNTVNPPTGSGNTHTGTWAMRVATQGVWSQTYQVANGINANKTYEASLWLKGSGDVLTLRVNNGEWGSEIKRINCPVINNWTKCSVSVNTLNNNQLTLILSDSGTSGRTIYVDDVFVGESGTTNKIINGGFESGNVNWLNDGNFSIVNNP